MAQTEKLDEATVTPGRRRWWPVAGLVVVLLVGATPWLDRSAEGYYEQALTRSLLAFGLARALNGAISVIQGTELELHPAGVGVSFAPGQLIDPVNDLVERFSWLMLASSTSLGVQKILMDITAWWGVRLILALASCLLLFSWWRKTQTEVFSAVALRFFLLALFLRFAMPLMVVLNHAIYDQFMADDYAVATGAIQRTSEELETIQAEQNAPDKSDDGLLGSLSRWLDDTVESIDVRDRMEALKHRLGELTDHLLKLAAVFVLQSLLLPLLFLWLLARGISGLGKFR
jgi:hypothetical protein